MDSPPSASITATSISTRPRSWIGATRREPLFPEARRSAPPDRPEGVERWLRRERSRNTISRNGQAGRQRSTPHRPSAFYWRTWNLRKTRVSAVQEALRLSAPGNPQIPVNYLARAERLALRRVPTILLVRPRNRNDLRIARGSRHQFGCLGEFLFSPRCRFLRSVFSQIFSWPCLL